MKGSRPVKARDFIRPGHRIEVGCTRRGRPGYRWVQGWQVFNPDTGRWSVEMRWYDALSVAQQIKDAAT